jgi:acyl-[acyl carrier protein]--UDP-N-acetylglucosamine O-acyltransferase
LRYKYVIGRGRELQRALAAWRELAPDTELRPVDMDAEGSQATLENIDPLDSTAFVAADAYFLNFHRLELMSGVRMRGIAMPALVERGAVVGADVKILDNTWIGAGAVIQPGCRIGFNVVIGPGAIVGGGAEIGQSAFIDAGVTIGHGARIGTKATLGLGVTVTHGVAIGALCVIDKPGRYEADIAAKTFIQSSHAHPMVIVGE